MAEVKPNIITFVKVKVVGVGGSGGAAINRMIESGIQEVEFIAVNTDLQVLRDNKAQTKIPIGQRITKGLGAGMDPEIGRMAAEESREELREALEGADMVFITCGLGGGTGSGSSPVIAKLARDFGALTIAIVTKPFSFEGARRKNIAEQYLAELIDEVDAVITISNDKLLQVVDKKISLLNALAAADEILKQGVRCISEIITVPGLINVDFADVKSVMQNAGSALMGIGQAAGENKAIEAAKAAINSPLLEMSIEGARGVLFTIVGGKDLTMHEVNEVAKVITSSTNENARIIFGVVIDEQLKDEIKIIVIATGFNSTSKFSPRIDIIKKNAPYLPSTFLKNKIEEKSEQRLSAPAGKKSRVSTFKAAQAEPAKKKEKDEEDDELSIPAFIRRKML